MSQVILPKLNVTGKAEWSAVEDNDVAIREVVNGELDNTNLSAKAGITGGKLAEGTIEAKQLADAAATSRKFKPTVGVVTASEELVLGAAYASVPGAKLTITPAVASTLLVTTVFDFELTGQDTGLTQGQGGDISLLRLLAIGSLSVDGAAEQSNIAIFRGRMSGIEGQFTYPIFRGTVSQVYALSLSAAEHTILMRAKMEGDAVTARAMATHTRFSYLLMAS